MKDLSVNNMLISANISSAYIYSLPNNNTNTLTIGSNAKTIRIGGPGCTVEINADISNVYTSTSSIVNSINNKFITLNNISSTDIGNSGININKSDNAYSAFFYVSKDEKQVKFKAPSSSTVLSINLHDLSKNLFTNNSGILVLNRYNEIDIQNLNNLGINHQINVSPFDISHILQRSMTESTTTKQVVSTDLSVKGNLIINSSTTSTISALDISGNFVHSNGWITQF
jgi:hypothetical protein